MIKVAHTVGHPLDDLGFVVTAFNVAICPRDIHGVKNLLEPVAVSFGAISKLRNIHHFNREKPVYKPLLALYGGFGSNHRQELIFNAISVCKPGSNFKHKG